MDLTFGTTYTYRRLGEFTELPVFNMFAEQEPSEEATSLISRPGIIRLSQIDTSGYSIGAIYSNSGVFDGDIFMVSHGNIYSYAPKTLLGTFGSSYFPSIAAYPSMIFFNDGQVVKSWDGTALVDVTLPSIEVSKILTGGGRLILIERDSGRFFWSDVAGTTVDALSYSTAENSPDLIKDALFVGDSLILFGTDTVETWQTTTNPDQPFLPLKGRTFETGIKNYGACTEFSGGFAWASPHGAVYINDTSQRISFPGLEAEIEFADSVKVWKFLLNGLEFLNVRTFFMNEVGLGLPEVKKDWIYNLSSGTWSRFKKYGYENWPLVGFSGTRMFAGEDGYLCMWNNQNPTTLQESRDVNYTDFGGPMERSFRAGAIIKTGGLTVHNLRLRTNVGTTYYTSGLYRDPIIEMRTSKDGGNNWSEWKQRLLGAEGEYRKEITWNSQGMFSQPYFLAEFKVTDPVSFRVSSVVINEERRGR